MVEAQITLTNPTGLHARPAALFTQTAGKFKDTKVKIIKSGREVDAKSILGVMSLGLTCGTSFMLRAEGAEEQAVVDVLAKLIENGFGER
jgi:phosphocarrier protein